MKCGEFTISSDKKSDAAVILGYIAALKMRKFWNACYIGFSNGTIKIFPVLLFDMDGVLINVEAQDCRAIIKMLNMSTLEMIHDDHPAIYNGRPTGNSFEYEGEF